MLSPQFPLSKKVLLVAMKDRFANQEDFPLWCSMHTSHSRRSGSFFFTCYLAEKVPRCWTLSWYSHLCYCSFGMSNHGRIQLIFLPGQENLYLLWVIRTFSGETYREDSIVYRKNMGTFVAFGLDRGDVW